MREHTDYGVLTILAQDEVGGLEVRLRETGEWVPAPPVPGSFVINIGDMLERWTAGHYRATPHRVKNVTSTDRLSAPFFFDPGWHCRVQPLPAFVERARAEGDPAAAEHYAALPPIMYGDYILAKVLRVFPQLRQLSLTDTSVSDAPAPAPAA